MTTGKKTALSLLISVIIFSLSAIFLYSGVFEKIETRFYQPAVINGIVESLNTVEKSLDEYHRMNFLRFGDFLSKESVKVSFLPNPGQKAITERNGFTGKLFEQNPGLKGIRFIDFQGRGVHYSTYKNDVLATNKNVTAFKNYDQLDTNVRYQEISQEENSTGELFLDESKEEILYLLPFIDNYNAYQGTAVFYVSVRDLENFLVTRNLIKQGESLILFNSKENNLKGLVKSLSVIGKKLVLEIQNLEGIGIPGNTSFADENGNSYMLLTVKNSPYEIFTGEIANDELFLFPDSAKNLLLVTIVITVFLAFFLLFNIRQDSYSIIHQRVIELEKEIIREYINHRDNLTWDKLLDEMEMKKGAVSREIKKALGTGWKKHGALIDDYFNESWEELISVLWEKKENSGNQESINEIKKMSQSYVNDIFKDEGVHSSHIFYILCLKKHGQMTQMQLSKATKNDKAHTNRIISGLIDKNLIESDSPSRERNQMWRLTKSGEEIAQKVDKVLEKCVHSDYNIFIMGGKLEKLISIYVVNGG